jgi:hypothetical protein
MIKQKVAMFFSGRINNNSRDLSIQNILKIKETYDPVFFISSRNIINKTFRKRGGKSRKI